MWFAADIVALVSGIMWDAKQDVSFTLQIVALKTLPVLVLGEFTSILGAIVGGLIRGGIESWFAFIIALVFLLFRLQGLFDDKTRSV